MKIIVVNVNTSASMTKVIAAGARRYAPPDPKRITGWPLTPRGDRP